MAILGGHDSSHPYFDGNAFANPGNGILGTTGRNILRGPGLFAMNGSISRIFPFKEGKLEFTAKAQRPLRKSGQDFDVIQRRRFLTVRLSLDADLVARAEGDGADSAAH